MQYLLMLLSLKPLKFTQSSVLTTDRANIAFSITLDFDDIIRLFANLSQYLFMHKRQKAKYPVCYSVKKMLKLLFII